MLYARVGFVLGTNSEESSTNRNPKTYGPCEWQLASTFSVTLWQIMFDTRNNQYSEKQHKHQTYPHNSKTALHNILFLTDTRTRCRLCALVGHEDEENTTCLERPNASCLATSNKNDVNGVYTALQILDTHAVLQNQDKWWPAADAGDAHVENGTRWHGRHHGDNKCLCVLRCLTNPSVLLLKKQRHHPESSNLPPQRSFRSLEVSLAALTDTMNAEPPLAADDGAAPDAARHPLDLSETHLGPRWALQASQRTHGWRRRQTCHWKRWSQLRTWALHFANTTKTSLQTAWKPRSNPGADNRQPSEAWLAKLALHMLGTAPLTSEAARLRFSFIDSVAQTSVLCDSLFLSLCDKSSRMTLNRTAISSMLIFAPNERLWETAWRETATPQRCKWNPSWLEPKINSPELSTNKSGVHSPIFEKKNTVSLFDFLMHINSDDKAWWMFSMRNDETTQECAKCVEECYRNRKYHGLAIPFIRFTRCVLLELVLSWARTTKNQQWKEITKTSPNVTTSPV